MLCIETNGHVVVEAATGSGTCTCSSNSGLESDSILHLSGDCGPCVDQALSTSVFTRLADGMDEPLPPAALNGAVSFMGRAPTSISSFRLRGVVPDAAAHLLRSTILLI